MDLTNKIIERDADGQIIFCTVQKYALFMSYGRIGMDAYTLYSHYQFTAILQSTNSVWALDSYCRQGLDWGRDRFDKAKALLIDLHLISEQRLREKDGKLGTKIVKVFMKSSFLEPKSISNDVHLPEKPQEGFPSCGKTATNTLTKKGNALTNKGKGTFTKPTVKEVGDYLKEQGITTFTPEKFVDYYESKGWMIGKNKMKDWKAAVRTWKSNSTTFNNKNNQKSIQQEEDWYYGEER